MEQNRQLLSRNANLLLQLNSNMNNFATASSNAISGDASKHNLSFASIEHDDQMILFYTGLRNATVFQWFLSLFKDKMFTCCKLSLEDHLLLVLMKLRLGLLNKDLAFRFCVSFQAISKIYRTWIPVMAAEVKFLIVWPNRNIIRKNLPTSFKGKFSDCVVIIDCTEIFIERPFSLHARVQTWSNYKNTNTIKYLLGITPSGSICFLSPGWGGRVSDKEITVKSGFLDKLSYGDVVLADRGFTVAEEVATQGAALKLPKFTKGKTQMPQQDIEHSQQIASLRIHVERVIGRMRKFSILQSVIPLKQVDLLDYVMVIITAMVNISPSVVKNDST